MASIPPFAGTCTLIQVFDMLESVRFYEETLGFTIDKRSPDVPDPYPHFNWALLKRDGVEIMLNTAYEAVERPSSPDPLRRAAHRDTALYFGCRDVRGMYAALRARGIALDAPRTNHGMTGITIADPDGYVLVFHWPADDLAPA